MLLYVILAILAAAYTWLFLACAVRWRRMIAKTGGEEAKSSISIVVPFRNESKSLHALLDWLHRQEYRNPYEVVLVNDHSEDDSHEICNLFLEQYKPAGWHLLLSSGEGKKAALRTGIQAARYDWILTTDADCTGTNHWVAGMAAAVNTGILMVSGPVRFRAGDARMLQFQQVESAGLIAIGASSLDAGLPTMCNGANLLFRKSAWEGVGGYASHAHLASGDDELLMHALNRQSPGSVVFQKSDAACVDTAAQRDLKQLMQQRRRWLSKGKAHPGYVKALRMGIGLFYLLLVITLLMAPFLDGAETLAVGVCVLLAKTSAEYIFYRQVLPFFSLQAGWLSLLRWQPFQILYPLLLAFWPGSKRFSWKNRHYF